MQSKFDKALIKTLNYHADYYSRMSSSNGGVGCLGLIIIAGIIIYFLFR